MIIKFNLQLLLKQKMHQKLFIMFFCEDLYKRKLHFKLHHIFLLACLFYVTISLCSASCIFLWIFWFLTGERFVFLLHKEISLKRVSGKNKSLSSLERKR